jgi:V/A-type H+-transporting ATPase subunit E
MQEGYVMTTIEDKISLFSKIIYDKLNEEKEERLGVFNDEALKQINSERQNIEELKKNLQIEVFKKANIKANEIVAKEKLNKQREILALKGSIIKETLEEIKERLIVFVTTEEYKEYFLELFQSILKEVEEGSYYAVVLSRDYERFKKEIEDTVSLYSNNKIQIKFTEEDFIGGIILKDFQGKFKIDHSLYSKLLDCEELIGVKVMEMLA